GRSAGAAPSSAASSGTAKMSNVSDADTGYPGAPRTGVASTTPSTTGCPGRTATPCTTRTPSRSTTPAVWSSRPALDPATTMTRSARAAASRAVARRQQELGSADVLADRANVLVWRHGAAQLGTPGVVVMDVLAHDDGVEAVRHRVTRVDDDIGRHVQEDRRALAGAHGLRRPH